MILARSRLECFTRNSVEITLPMTYRSMITRDHVSVIERHLAKAVSPSCRLSMLFAEIGDAEDTIAAEEARRQFEAQQKEFERVRKHPMMQAIIEAFHVDPDAFRFTINQDRTSP